MFLSPDNCLHYNGKTVLKYWTKHTCCDSFILFLSWNTDFLGFRWIHKPTKLSAPWTSNKKNNFYCEFIFLQLNNNYHFIGFRWYPQPTKFSALWIAHLAREIISLYQKYEFICKRKIYYALIVENGSNENKLNHSFTNLKSASTTSSKDQSQYYYDKVWLKNHSLLQKSIGTLRDKICLKYVVEYYLSDITPVWH